jgi:hypothetical protein
MLRLEVEWPSSAAAGNFRVQRLHARTKTGCRGTLYAREELGRIVSL